MVRRPLWLTTWLLALAIVATACGNDASVDFGAGDGDSAGNGTGQTDGSDASDPLDDGTDPSESDAPSDTASPTPPASTTPGTPADPPAGVDVGEPAPPTNAPQPDRSNGSAGETTPRPGQADVHARTWESAEVQSDDVTVQVKYWTGVEPCHVLDRVEVREDAMTVTITLYEGSQPGFDGACTAQAVERWTKVKLSAPLKGRVIVDGAAKGPTS